MTNEDKILALLGSMAQSMEEIRSGMNDFRLEMKQELKEVNARIDGVEKRLDTRIDRVENKLDSRIDALEKRMDTRFDRVEDNISNINSRELHIMEIAGKGRRSA